MSAVPSSAPRRRTNTVEPEELRIVTEWDSGGSSFTYLIRDYDLNMHVESSEGARTPNGQPLRYNATEGMVLFALGVDGEGHDQVRVMTGPDTDMIEVRSQLAEATERSLATLRKFKGMQV